MLEIPVSTVNVVRKKSLFKRKPVRKEDLKDKVVESVNERVNMLSAEAEEEPLNDAAEEFSPFGDAFVGAEDLSPKPKPEKARRKPDAAGVVLICEAVAACLIAAAIFVTNVFMPNSAINTFVGSLSAVEQKEASYSDFKLTSVVSELSEAEVTVTQDGVLCFTSNTSVYPVCGGKVTEITKNNGLYTVEIAHTSSFSSVVTGLDVVYAGEGDTVVSNIPFAYSKGENQVRVSMYNGEKLLNCYTLSGAVPVWNS